MEERKRVYRAKRPQGKGLTYLLLFLSAALLLSGLVKSGGNVALDVVPTATPIPTGEVFDESPDSREWTLTARSWYALQLGSFDNEESASALAEQYRPRGAAGYVWVDSRYRTLAALYASKEDAQSVRTKLWETHGIDAYPYEIALPAVTLRMKGMKGQLDMAQAAFEHIGALIESLQALSVAMDRQELTVDEAFAQLQAMDQQAQTVRLRLCQRFAEPRHETIAALIGVLDAHHELSAQIAASLSAAEMATAVKYLAMDTLYRFKSIYAAFAGT